MASTLNALIAAVETQLDTVSGAVIVTLPMPLSEYPGIDHKLVTVAPPYELERIGGLRGRGHRLYNATLTIEWSYQLALDDTDANAARDAALDFQNALVDSMTSAAWGAQRRTKVDDISIERRGSYLVGRFTLIAELLQVAA